MSRVVHTAQALVDMVIEVPSLPPRGGNVMAPPATPYAGGAVNILLAAARTGAEAVHAGAIGTGPNGDLIRAALDAEHVAYSAPPVPDADSAVCVVMVEPTAERTFITTMAAERRITVESLATSEPRPGDLVCVSGYSLFEPTREPLLAWLESLDDDVLVVLDPGAPFAAMPEDLRRRMLVLTDVWTSNADEAAELTGVTDPAESVAAVAAEVARHRPTPGADGTVRPAPDAPEPPRPNVATRTASDEPGTFRLHRAVAGSTAVIVRDGAQGCWVHVDGDTTHVPGFPQTPVDTNGAGDAHTGAMLGRVAQGASWQDAARWANAAAAIKVTRRGPATAPRAPEVDAFLTSHNT